MNIDLSVCVLDGLDSGSHSNFQPNTIFREVPMHPRFGFIMSLVAKRNIAKNEEILVNYNYESEYAPKWFQELYRGKPLYHSGFGCSGVEIFSFRAHAKQSR